MTPLTSYLKSNQTSYLKTLPNTLEEITLEGFCEAHELEINEESIDLFYRRRSYIRIDENLKSHKASKLIKVLKSKFDLVSIKTDNPDARSIIEINVGFDTNLVNRKSTQTFELDNTKEGREFKKYLNFYNYYLTYVEMVANGYILYLEPLYTDPIIHPNACYHVCRPDAIDSILKTGLRPKIGKSKVLRYRYFPERVFMIAYTDHYKEDIKEVVNDLQLEDYIVLEIDTSKCNITFFKDLAAENENCIYTYESIPPQLIKIRKDL